MSRASQVESHPHLVPCHWGTSWLHQSGTWVRFPLRLQTLLPPQKMCSVQRSALSTTWQYPQVWVSSSLPRLNTTLLSRPVSSNGSPELPWGQPKVLLHILPELLPHPGFCFSYHRSPSDLPVPVHCSRQPLGQSSPEGLLFQLDGLDHSSCLYNEGSEHGPLRFHVPNLPQDARKMFPALGVEDPADRGLHKMFGFVQQSPLASDPTHSTYGNFQYVCSMHCNGVSAACRNLLAKSYNNLFSFF